MTVKDLINEMTLSGVLDAGLTAVDYEGNGVDLPVHIPDEFREDKPKKKKKKKVFRRKPTNTLTIDKENI
jgi:hypothetical protein